MTNLKDVVTLQEGEDLSLLIGLDDKAVEDLSNKTEAMYKAILHQHSLPENHPEKRNYGDFLQEMINTYTIEEVLFLAFFDIKHEAEKTATRLSFVEKLIKGPSEKIEVSTDEETTDKVILLSDSDKTEQN